jgi:hypothetical protein
MIDEETNTIYNKNPHELLICNCYHDIKIMMPWGQSWNFIDFKKAFNFESELLKEKELVFKSDEDRIRQIYKNIRSKYFKEDTSILYQNKTCKYYPCRKNIEYFNCKFCICPLYFLKECNGDYTIDKNGIKQCYNCDIPYDGIMGYFHIIETLKNYKVNFNGKF